MGKLAVGLAVGCAVATCGIAAVMVGKRISSRRRWRKVVRVLEELKEGCSTSVERLGQVVDAMAVEMHAGLASEGGSKLKMLLTFIHNLPDGNEKGTYYALVLGGTNFRVVRVQLGEEKSTIHWHNVDRKPIPEHLMTSVKAWLSWRPYGDAIWRLWRPKTMWRPCRHRDSTCRPPQAATDATGRHGHRRRPNFRADIPLYTRSGSTQPSTTGP